MRDKNEGGQDEEIDRAPTLRETLEQTAADITERETPPAEQSDPAAKPAAQSPAPDAAADAAAKPAKDGREANGRFKPKPGEQPQVVAVPGAAPAAAKPGAPAEAPKMWSAERKAAFAAMPPATQALILERETEMERVIARQDEERTFGRNIKQIVTPYEAIIRSEGGTPEKAVAVLMNSAYIVRRGTPEQKAQLIFETMRDFKIDPRLVFQMVQGQKPQPGQQQAVDPVALERQITERVTASLTEKQMGDKIGGEIQAFAADPKNVYFDRVRAKMASLFGSEQAQTLQEAYDQACWMDPAIRSELLAAQAKTQPTARGPNLSEKRRAGSSVAGSPGGIAASSGPIPKNETTRQTLERVAREVEERA